jgi:hypothetical protein
MIGKNGVQVGPMLQEFQGILTGTPQFFGSTKDILKEQKSA